MVRPIQQTHHNVRIWKVGLALVALFLFVGPAEAHSLGKKIDSPKRFRVLSDFNDEAVLDKETGFVWEREPAIGSVDWVQAINTCLDTEVGGRLGWRLPAAWELFTLIDLTEANPALPAGHPFILSFTGDDDFWTAERLPDTITNAQTVELNPGQRDSALISANRHFWCVRGAGGPSYTP